MVFLYFSKDAIFCFTLLLSFADRLFAMKKVLTGISAILLLLTASCTSCAQIRMGSAVPDPQKVDVDAIDKPRVKGKIMTGADQTGAYLPYLKDKKIGMVVNRASIIGSGQCRQPEKSRCKHCKIFGPEHGFETPVPVKVASGIDRKRVFRLFPLKPL